MSGVVDGLADGQDAARRERLAAVVVFGLEGLHDGLRDVLLAAEHVDDALEEKVARRVVHLSDGARAVESAGKARLVGAGLDDRNIASSENLGVCDALGALPLQHGAFRKSNERTKRRVVSADVERLSHCPLPFFFNPPGPSGFLVRPIYTPERERLHLRRRDVRPRPIPASIYPAMRPASQREGRPPCRPHHISIVARRATGDSVTVYVDSHSIVSIHARRATGDRDNLCNYRRSNAAMPSQND